MLGKGKKYNLMRVQLPCASLDCVFKDETDMPTDLRELIDLSRESYKQKFGAGLNYTERFKMENNAVMMLMYTKAAASNRKIGRFTDGACSGSVKNE